MNRTQILQEFFPTSSLLSFPKTVSLENCFLIRHPDLGNKVRNSSWSHCLPDCELSFRSSRPFGGLHVFSSSHCCAVWHLKVAVPPRTGEKACCVYLCAAGTPCPRPPSAIRNAYGVSQLLTFTSWSVCTVGHNSLEGPFWELFLVVSFTCFGIPAMGAHHRNECFQPDLCFHVSFMEELPWEALLWYLREQQTCSLCCLTSLQGSNLPLFNQIQEKLARLLKYSSLFLELQFAQPLCCWKWTAHPDCCTSGQVQRTLRDVQGGSGSWRFG